MSKTDKTPERYLRFPLVRRIEHWANGLAFIMLAVTGIPQKYPDTGLSQSILRAVGGVENARIIHRVCAVVLAVVTIWHVGYALYHWYVKRGPLSMLPTKDDAINAWQALMYNLGRVKERPKQGFYTFEEKAEYWALIWGTAVMVITGFFLWNPITAARYLPGQLIPAAKAAHGGEALLAVLAVILWHFYHVFIKTFNKSMYTGYLSREEMEHEHPLAMHEPPPQQHDPVKLRGRRQRFFISYGLFTALAAVFIIWFVASEQTATATIPEAEPIDSFVALTPTPLPQTGDLSPAAQMYGTTWEENIGMLFSSRCGDCHNPRNGEANLDLNSYQGVLQGGDSGAAVVPNGAGASLVVIWSNLDNHPGSFSPAEIEAVRAWINNGAPEN